MKTKKKRPVHLVKEVCAFDDFEIRRSDIRIFALDNGTSGGYAVMDLNGRLLAAASVPVITEQDYTKMKKQITRLDVKWMLDIIENRLPDPKKALVVLERPYTFKGYKQVVAAARCHEATLIAFDLANVPKESITIIDSRAWQRVHFTETQLKDYNTKDLAWAFVARNFPEYANAPEGVIDAICIAAYVVWTDPLMENSRKN